MNDQSPFDHKPDAELGAVLRAALSGADDVQFAQRVVAAYDGLFSRHERRGWWNVLAAWAVPGLAAALVLVAATVIWFAIPSGNGNGLTGLGDPLSAANGQLAVPALLASSTTLDVDMVMAVALEN
jgi:hypothetical protein